MNQWQNMIYVETCCLLTPLLLLVTSENTKHGTLRVKYNVICSAFFLLNAAHIPIKFVPTSLDKYVHY